MKKIVRLTESDIRNMVVRVLNEALCEGEFDDIEGLEPDPEEKKAQMNKDWDDYTTGVEKTYDGGYKGKKTIDDTDLVSNKWNISDTNPGMWALQSLGYDRYKDISPSDRLFAQAHDINADTSVKKGREMFAADIDTLNDWGDIDSDGNTPIIGFDPNNNGKPATRTKYDFYTALEEAVTRAIRKCIK